MAPRKEFALIFSSDPPSADVVREDFVILGETDMRVAMRSKLEIKFRWEKKKDKFEEVAGTILDIGLKKDMVLRAKKVKSDGSFAKDGEAGQCGSRKQEMERQRLQASRAQSLQLQDVATVLNTAGADTATESLRPVVRQKKRSTQRKTEIEARLNNMACFTRRPGDIKLLGNYNIFFPAGRAAVYKGAFSKHPKLHFKRLMKILIPKEVCLIDGVAATTCHNCVGIPTDIIDCMSAYVSAHAQKHKVDIDFDPEAMIRHYISNTKKKERRSRATQPNEPSPSSDEDSDQNEGQHDLSNGGLDASQSSSLSSSEQQQDSSQDATERYLAVASTSRQNGPSVSEAASSSPGPSGGAPMDTFLDKLSKPVATPVVTDHGYLPHSENENYLDFSILDNMDSNIMEVQVPHEYVS